MFINIFKKKLGGMMISILLNLYPGCLLVSFIGFIICFLFWLKNKNFKKIMIIFLVIFFVLLIIGISAIAYILYGVIKSN